MRVKSAQLSARQLLAKSCARTSTSRWENVCHWEQNVHAEGNARSWGTSAEACHSCSAAKFVSAPRNILRRARYPLYHQTFWKMRCILVHDGLRRGRLGREAPRPYSRLATPILVQGSQPCLRRRISMLLTDKAEPCCRPNMLYNELLSNGMYASHTTHHSDLYWSHPCPPWAIWHWRGSTIFLNSNADPAFMPALVQAIMDSADDLAVCCSYQAPDGHSKYKKKCLPRCQAPELLRSARRNQF
jgi:hypothetical protein